MRLRTARWHWLSDAGARDAAVVGCKAAGLARLAAHHRVPAGFVVPNDADGDELDELLEGCYAQLACRVGERQPRVAVRSSAIRDEGDAAPPVGHDATVLAVRGVGGVRTAIERRRASAATARALAYHEVRHASAPLPGLPVLVQHLVAADVSAVASSANPVTGDPAEVVVAASYGLGDRIAGGTTAADVWRVARTPHAIVECRIGTKERMTVPTAQGVRAVGVPPPLRGVACLDEASVLEVARLAVALEAGAGRPVHVECAFADARLHLLAARPLTTAAASGGQACQVSPPVSQPTRQ